MRALQLSGVAALVSLAVLCSCGPEPAASPIKPAGELPDIFAAIADGEYLTVGYLDVESGLRSDIGKVFLEHLGPVQQMIENQGGSPGKILGEVGFAIRFNSRSYPNFYRSLQLIAIVRTSLDEDALQQILNLIPHKTEDIEGMQVHEVSTSVFGLSSGDSLWLAMPRKGLLLVATFRELLNESLEALAEKRVSLKSGEKMHSLLAKVDKVSTGWLAIRQSVPSRNLIRFLAPFDDCIVRLYLAQELSIICVMEFNEAEEARIAVDGFALSRRQMKDFSGSIPKADDSRAVGGKTILEALGRFKAKQEGKLAIFSSTFDAGWFEENWPGTGNPPIPSKSDNEREQ